MKQKKTALLLAVTAAFALSLTGCSHKNDNVSNEVTNYYSVTMDGDLIYYSEDSEDVVEAGEMARTFMTECVNKSYLEPDSFREYAYYRKSIADELIAAGKQDLTKQTLLGNDLIIKAYDQNVLNMEFYYLNGLESCMVTMDSFSEFENASVTYAESAGIRVGKRYKRVTKVLLINEDGWKVDSYTQTAREEVK